MVGLGELPDEAHRAIGSLLQQGCQSLSPRLSDLEWILLPQFCIEQLEADGSRVADFPQHLDFRCQVNRAIPAHPPDGIGLLAARNLRVSIINMIVTDSSSRDLCQHTLGRRTVPRAEGIRD